MRARDPGEQHRASTPLELLFDLCFVVAVSQAAEQLHHGLGQDAITGTTTGYLMVFFAIWWAWMNFTWFASAYDTDDVPYRALTLLQMAGVLVLAAGVPDTFHHYDFTVVTIGYVVMRMAMLAQWVRAAVEHPAGRQHALRYATGIAACQLGWCARLALPDPWGEAAFPVLVLAELSVPLWAEHARTSNWHPGHINERYGLFTLIVLGEVVLASTNAVQADLVDGGLSPGLDEIAAGGLLLIFSMWWIYFMHSAAARIRESLPTTLLWAYGHYFIFASASAVGATVSLAVDVNGRGAQIGDNATAIAITAPVVVYLVLTTALHAGIARLAPGTAVATGTAIALLAVNAALADNVAHAVLAMGLTVTALLATRILLHQLDQQRGRTR
ncbi:low temperature requirement protein A [Saccharopolyspora sp. HNM0983]|uniref:Low temperature requirement protein A n=2 Tax=Saccharopolyspora montiporae TaxID=2781240 RepID=A0A929B679_9PSEU|nr:low temperature requirement protein A [Saccharopolyspora sp. HNM0983]